MKAKVKKDYAASYNMVNSLVHLAELKGAPDGRMWVLERIEAPLSGRINDYLTKAECCDLLDKLEAVESINEIV